MRSTSASTATGTSVSASFEADAPVADLGEEEVVGRGRLGRSNGMDRGTPPAIVQTTPVPIHAVHFGADPHRHCPSPSTP